MKEKGSVFGGSRNRRSFLKTGMVAGAATIGTAMLPASPVASLEKRTITLQSPKVTFAILTFLSALEQVEADLWIQYAELGEPRIRVFPRSIFRSPEGSPPHTSPGCWCSTATCPSTFRQHRRRNQSSPVSE